MIPFEPKNTEHSTLIGISSLMLIAQNRIFMITQNMPIAHYFVKQIQIHGAIPINIVDITMLKLSLVNCPDNGIGIYKSPTVIPRCPCMLHFGKLK